MCAQALTDAFGAKKERVEQHSMSDLKRELSVLLANATHAQHEVLARCSKVFHPQVPGFRNPKLHTVRV